MFTFGGILDIGDTSGGQLLRLEGTVTGLGRRRTCVPRFLRK